MTIAVTAGLLPGTVNNTATVKAAEADPNMANNSSTATTEVGLLGVVASASPTPTPTPTPTPSPTVLGENFRRGRALPVTGPRFPLGLLGLLGLCLLGAGVVLVRRGRARAAAEVRGETPGSRGRGERD